jgi:hypothetical protein
LPARPEKRKPFEVERAQNPVDAALLYQAFGETASEELSVS